MWILVCPLVAGILSGAVLFIFWCVEKIKTVLIKYIPSWREKAEESEKHMRQLEETVRLQNIGEDYIKYWANKERMPHWLKESSLWNAGLNEIRAGLIVKTGDLYLYEIDNLTPSKKEQIMKSMKELWDSVIAFNTVTQRGKIQDDDTLGSEMERVWGELTSILSTHNKTTRWLTSEKIESLTKQALLMPTGFPSMSGSLEKEKRTVNLLD